MKLGMKDFAFIALMLGLVAGSYAMVVRPHALQRESKLAEIRSMEVSMSDLQNQTMALEDLRARIDAQQRTVDQFESRQATDADVDGVMKIISEMAGANSLQCGAGKALRTDQAGAYTPQPIQISLSGDFNGFYSFLLQLETLPRVVRITNIKLEKIDGHEGQMHADLTMCVFFPAGDDGNAGTSAEAN